VHPRQRSNAVVRPLTGLVRVMFSKTWILSAFWALGTTMTVRSLGYVITIVAIPTLEARLSG
jgi:hypothetical protein